MGARMYCEIPRHRSCRMFRFRGCFHDSSSGCRRIRSLTFVEGGSARSCSGRGPAVAGPLKESEWEAGGRTEKRYTLKAARRSMAMAEVEEERGQRGIWYPGELGQDFVPVANSAALPHRATLPHARSSLPRTFTPRKYLGRPLNATLPSSHSALYVPWDRAL